MYIAKGKRKDLLYRALLWLERRTVRLADRVIAVNESHREIAVRRGSVPEERVVVVRSGPPRAWAGVQATDPALKRGRKYLVAYLGEMCEQDGVGHLLHAIRHYADTNPPDTQFVLIGGGPDQQRMRNMAFDMGLNECVHFTGRIPDQDLWRYLATADVCVDPDPLSEWSDLSTMNKIVEYMAFGRPVVAFRLKEHQRTAGDAAVYVEPNNDIKFSVAIRDLLTDEARAASMSEYATARFRDRLAWENSEKALVAMYFDLAGDPATERVLKPVRAE
jgi:glycosyltransferase involved in cell wall biosynthesis